MFVIVTIFSHRFSHYRKMYDSIPILNIAFLYSIILFIFEETISLPAKINNYERIRLAYLTCYATIQTSLHILLRTNRKMHNNGFYRNPSKITARKNKYTC